MPRVPGKGHEALRRGRWSESGAEYFLTICTSQHLGGLTTPNLFTTVLEQLETLGTEQIWQVRTATVMPDHVHLLVELGRSAELPSSIRLFKGRLAPALRSAGLRWERGYYDHCMRADEDRLPVFLYIFLNPNRENLAAIGQPWPGYICSDSDWTWFGTLTDNACPFPEWLH
jgi:REP element-mobilizing transposase RayT